jgi:hypothetical protein
MTEVAMVDLIVPAGTVLKIDQPSQVEPQYRLFRMETNAKIVASIDLTIKASRAEFAEGCVIDASGAAGTNGSNGVGATVNSAQGGLGTNGLPGQHGHNIAIEAGLARVGGLTIITDGGAGGRGGTGGVGGPGGFQDAGLVDVRAGRGGGGGSGAPGGDAGQISLAWMPLAANLPSASGKPPQGHIYRSNGGLGGTGGSGGAGGSGSPTSQGSPGDNGVTAANGKSLPVQLKWWPNPAALLWVQKQDIGPGPRAYHDIAFDPKRNRLVLFGGLVTGKPTGDTWEWDGRFWTQVADTGPVPRAYHAMAYDSAGQRILLFGGSDGGSVTAGAPDRVYRSDTWAWDGQDWVQLSDTGPSARQSHAMACDAGRGRVVLFSGGKISAQVTNLAAADTWEWDGVDWAQVADTGPSARLGAKLANVQDGVLLFGGTGANPAPGETWRWDGQHWLQVADSGPAPRLGHAIASDGLAVVLFGGKRLAAPDTRDVNDTWAWYDQTWRQIQDIGPSPRMGHAMAHVTGDDGDHVILYGGQAGEQFSDTWRLEDRS